MFGKNLLRVLSVSSLCLVSLVGADTQEQKAHKIKLYACYSPSHEELVKEWFLPSIKDDYELVLERHEQLCPTAVCRSPGWRRATLRKVEMIVKAIKDNWGAIFVFSDVDIQFFRPTKDILLDLIQGLDMVIQRDDPNGLICTGFFACRANERTLKVWEEVRRRLADIEGLKKNIITEDQAEFNKVVRSKGFELAWDYLPAKFLTGGTLTGKHWKEGDKLIIPPNIVLHHANWTPAGIKNKIAELKYVKNYMMQQNNILVPQG